MSVFSLVFFGNNLDVFFFKCFGEFGSCDFVWFLWRLMLLQKICIVFGDVLLSLVVDAFFWIVQCFSSGFGLSFWCVWFIVLWFGFCWFSVVFAGFQGCCGMVGEVGTPALQKMKTGVVF